MAQGVTTQHSRGELATLTLKVVRDPFEFVGQLLANIRAHAGCFLAIIRPCMQTLVGGYIHTCMCPFCSPLLLASRTDLSNATEGCTPGSRLTNLLESQRIDRMSMHY
jgi:hypothetical protein